MSGVHTFAGSVTHYCCKPRSLLFQSLQASAPFSSFPNIVNMLLVSSWSTAFLLVSVAVVVICPCFFCCEDDDEYSNSSRRGHYHQTDQLRQRHSSRQSHNLTSHIVGETGQIPSTSVHVSTSTATMVDVTSDVHCPRLTSPPSEVFPSTRPTLSRPPIHRCIHCSPSERLYTNARPSDCSKFNFFEPSATCPVWHQG